MSKYCKLACFLLFLFLTSFTFKPTDQNEWVKFQTYKGVNFYQKKVVKETSRYKHAYILFKYENTGDQSVNLNWKLNIWHNDNCRSCSLPSPNEYEMSLSLKAGQTTTGKINDQDKMLKLFYKDLTNSENQQLTKIEFKKLR